MFGLDGTLDKANQDIRQILKQFEDAEGNIVNVTADRLHSLLAGSIEQTFAGLGKLEENTMQDFNTFVDLTLSKLNGMTVKISGPLSAITGELTLNFPQAPAVYEVKE